VIPVRDEAATIGKLLDSIDAQTRRPDEVVFVDGGSRDETVALLSRACERDAKLRVIEAGEATPGRGRNVGIEAARCEWIALTDAGIRLEPEWLERLAEVAEQDPTLEVVYGNYEPVTDAFVERCAALLYTHRKQLRAGGRQRGPFIASSLVRRSVWESVGGFPDLRAAEDEIFMERVRERGCKTGWSPRATVWWQPQPTLRGTWRRFLVFSRFNVWAGRERYWHYGIARFYAVCLVFVALALLHSWWWLSVPVLGLFARAAKSIWQRRDGRGLLWALNPLQFAGVAVMLAVIDAATFAGWAQALLHRPQALAATSPNHSKSGV
jgi:glycosyltransferase involved in cell wall biosynthesis